VGVKWHEGKPFTAEDVAFTMTRAPNVANRPGGFIRSIACSDIVGAHILCFHTHALACARCSHHAHRAAHPQLGHAPRPDLTGKDGQADRGDGCAARDKLTCPFDDQPF